jgi:hypothetical protein
MLFNDVANVVVILEEKNINAVNKRVVFWENY